MRQLGWECWALVQRCLKAGGPWLLLYCRSTVGPEIQGPSQTGVFDLLTPTTQQTQLIGHKRHMIGSIDSKVRSCYEQLNSRFLTVLESSRA